MKESPDAWKWKKRKQFTDELDAFHGVNMTN